MTNGGSDRFDRIERILESLAQNQERLVSSQGQIVQTAGRILEIQQQQQGQIQTLADAATRHEAMISRLDAILERLIYREGRGNGEQPQL